MATSPFCFLNILLRHINIKFLQGIANNSNFAPELIHKFNIINIKIMARTKKQLRQDLLRLLQAKGEEFVVKYNENLHPNRLRSRNGLRCYCIAADNGKVVCKPWYGALAASTWNLRDNLLLREINELIDQVKYNGKGLEGTDAIDEAVTNASSTIADAYFVQIGQDEVADDHDDDWYDLQEELRGAMLDAAFEVCKKYNYNDD